MEPASILEVTNTVIALTVKIYRILKALHDAPEEITDYIKVLDRMRSVFIDVQDYLKMHLGSSFQVRDGLRLQIIEQALNDCELEFTLQLSLVESMDVRTSKSGLNKNLRKGRWVLSKGNIEELTVKLQKTQDLLGVAMASSSAKHDVLIREKLEAVGIELHQMSERQEAEIRRQEILLLHLQQYIPTLQSTVTGHLARTQELQTRSETRIEDVMASAGFMTNSGGLRTRSTTDLHVDPYASRPTSDVVESATDQNKLAGVSGAAPSQLSDAAALDCTTSTDHLQSPSADPLSTDSNQTPFEAAMNKFKGNKYDTIRALQDTPTWDELQKQFEGLSRTRPTTFKSFEKLVEKLRAPAIAVQSSPVNAISFLHGAMRVILSAAARMKEIDSVTSSLLELTEVIEICNRESQLYNSEKLTRLFESCYSEVLGVTELSLRQIQGPRLTQSFLIDERRETQWGKAMTRIRQLSENILREVDYQHRLEMRETSSRIVDVQVQQHKMVALLENQQRVLAEMAEERQVLTAIRGQQAVLQAIQQIERQLQSHIPRASSDTVAA